MSDGEQKKLISHITRDLGTPPLIFERRDGGDVVLTIAHGGTWTRLTLAKDKAEMVARWILEGEGDGHT